MGLRKRSLTIHGHRTSIALEPEFWAELDRAARSQALSLAALLTQIDDARQNTPQAADSFSSVLRVWVLSDVKASAS